jgi:hypothetical protein
MINMTFVRSCSQLQVAQGILDAQDTVNQLEGKINNDAGGGHEHGNGNGQANGNGKGKGKGKNRVSEELTNQLNDLRTSIGQARDGLALALQGGIGVLEQQGKSIPELFANAGLDVPAGF